MASIITIKCLKTIIRNKYIVFYVRRQLSRCLYDAEFNVLAFGSDVKAASEY